MRKRTQSEIELDEENKKARELGLSYGQYQARKLIERLKEESDRAKLDRHLK